MYSKYEDKFEVVRSRRTVPPNLYSKKRTVCDEIYDDDDDNGGTWWFLIIVYLEEPLQLPCYM
jgi:hypothetical protein